ncbi:phosphatidylserine decarboxylase family protein [Tunicatimonas pelagia]|uniref:phosphatidylserine decarboxylase family protein n=1 Tax=Tunicatimonas pelagia TaxID=931531 RepID=UPI0026653E60|nr:phosphatidylserine decarboxylase family protein [Tunicatimonas pelagia]WKN41529.1 phosphatidylserine decarboxylase family protein [Tunicatimonas pelagia]
MTIHKEGRVLLLVSSIVLILFNFAVAYFFPGRTVLQTVILITSAVLYLLILQFFRNPRIVVTRNEEQILAPADGKVVVIEEAEEKEYFQERRMQVSIFMSPINVHVNRNPASGLVKYFKYHAGQYLVAWHPKSSTDNERTTMVLQLPSGLEILVRQIAGAMARRIKWYVGEGDTVQQGEEFGFIKFGSRVDVYLPLNAEVKVSIGDKTKAGRTVLAEITATPAVQPETAYSTEEITNRTISPI